MKSEALTDTQGTTADSAAASVSKRRVPVVWSPFMVPHGADLLISPSAKKPQLLVHKWRVDDLLIDLVDCVPVGESSICLAHEPRFVRAVLTGRVPNGFGTVDSRVNSSLRYTVGSMVQSARLALKGAPVVCSPTSGFHHSHYRECGSYCTFNGLMIAALDVLDEYEKSILILDLDQHYGDGTADIIEKTACGGLVTQQSGFHGDPEDIISDLPSMIRDSCADVVFYQAGVDSHIEDKCHGKFTTDQLYRRDLVVFQTCKEMDIPVVWNLAGGYQSTEKVVDLHTNTMLACIEVYCGR